MMMMMGNGVSADSRSTMVIKSWHGERIIQISKCDDDQPDLSLRRAATIGGHLS
jgi:hypothetical protein